MDSTQNESTRTALMKLTASGDLLDLARDLRELGVESLLLCRPDGRIEQVVTDRQIAHLATWHSDVDFGAPVTAARRSRPADVQVPAPRPASNDSATPRRSPEGEGVRSQAR